MPVSMLLSTITTVIKAITIMTRSADEFTHNKGCQPGLNHSCYRFEIIPFKSKKVSLISNIVILWHRLKIRKIRIILPPPPRLEVVARVTNTNKLFICYAIGRTQLYWSVVQHKVSKIMLDIYNSSTYMMIYLCFIIGSLCFIITLKLIRQVTN